MVVQRDIFKLKTTKECCTFSSEENKFMIQNNSILVKADHRTPMTENKEEFNLTSLALFLKHFLCIFASES